MSFKYAVNCDTLPFLGWDVLEDPQTILKATKDAGYDGVDLPGNPERVNAESLRKAVDDLGLTVPEVSGGWAWAGYEPGKEKYLSGPDQAALRRGVEASKQVIDLAVELGAWLFPALAIQPPIYEVPFSRLPTKVMRDTFLDSLRQICTYAGERNITVVVEPLSRYESFPGVATKVSEVVSLIEDLGASNLGVQPDVYHMNLSEVSIPEAVRLGGKHIRHMHMNESNHYALGTGHGEHHAIIRALKDVGYSGYLSVYMPITTQEAWHRKQRADLSVHLRWAIGYLKQIEAAVDLEQAMYDPEAPYAR